MSNHLYKATITWTGNTGKGTSDYRGYERSHTISAVGKPDILGSSDPVFRGDKTRYNPEEFLVASLSTCHMLQYLHLCSVSGVMVIDYTDEAVGSLVETPDGGGHFKEVILYPKVVVSDASMIEKAIELHHNAHKVCFIANSCNFPILHQPTCYVRN